MIIFVQIIRKRLTMRDKVVIVTGASSGIGKALVYELARQKAKIAIASRNIDRTNLRAFRTNRRIDQ